VSVADQRKLGKVVGGTWIVGERAYGLLCLDATRLACSSEFVALHRQLDHALRENDGHLDERAILEAREKARRPEPEPDPREGERDEDGCLSDAAIDVTIDRMRRSRAIAGNGDGGPEIAEVEKQAYALGVKAFEAGRVEVATFSA
jgi:hypothetical protein